MRTFHVKQRLWVLGRQDRKNLNKLFYLFFVILEPLKPVIQHGPAGKAQRRLLVQVEGLKNVEVYIGDDMETLNGTIIYIRYI